ncbi:HAUS augmin-like complex subunit 5 isoform X2 [Anser cygnoides]|uniref:HAUS augmin-like complex subunit 5 isoform X2 n=1 Tax=Anser cygnoides TaxID=8845 RepID=UPI0034D24016
MEPGLGLQERTERLLRRSEAVLCQRPPPPRPPRAGPGGAGPRGGGGGLPGCFAALAGRQEAGLPAGPAPRDVTRGAGLPRSQEAVRRRGAEPEDYSSHEALRPGGRGYEEEAPWGRAVGQEAAAGELLQQALDSDEAEAPEDPVLRALRGRRRALRGLLRLCSGPCADIWLYVTRHVRHPQNVKKIRGNLLWYRHLEETEGAPPPRPRRAGGAAAAAPGAGGAAGGAGGPSARPWPWRRSWGRGFAAGGGACRGSAPARAGGGGGGGGAAPEGGASGHAPSASAGRGGAGAGSGRRHGNGAGSAGGAAQPEPGAGGDAAGAAGAPPTRRPAAADGRRPVALAPSRPGGAVPPPPAAVLWALEQLALESTRGLKPLPSPLDLEAEAGAPPTVQSLLQECWGTVGGCGPGCPPWAPACALRLRLQRLRRELDAALGGTPGPCRLPGWRWWRRGWGRGRRWRGVAEPGGPPRTPRSQGGAEGSRGTALRSRHRLLRRQQRLRSLAASTAALRGGCGPGRPRCGRRRRR